ncbi:hypothetical protein [Burkholderia vietnamiensis]|uniref:hypothetical protein n=1 Tax=Burkholderia vietnamiensis TaxID=60552 RepID=UPI000A6BFC38|nr:hypothetical protein [Burkholderia vietnamiensis]MDN8110321.1 hypothetical protein [Burkholderia vietnamiensis]HDR9173601.1 hypothetical protein [Burkholderia vietnamiensis]
MRVATPYDRARRAYRHAAPGAPEPRRQRIGSASAAFRPHPLADPVKLHVSAH